jgi:subfamily B ATP-binding cassette protein HlyB/CyaB
VRISDEERREQQLASIPLYLAIGFLVRPPLREKSEGEIQSRRGEPAISCVGMQTVKSAVEPQTRAQWEERLASYVRTGFEAQLLGAGGQQALQYVSKLTTALLLLFGAYAVINNDLTIGALVAFNMISNQMVQLILRLSQLWQDLLAARADRLRGDR